MSERELSGQRSDLSGDGITDCFSAASSERRPVLDFWPPWPVIGGRQHGESGAAVNKLSRPTEN